MQKTLAQIAQLVDGQVVGDETLEIVGVNTLENAQSGEITFFSNPKYESKIGSTKASAVLTTKKLQNCLCSQVITADPYYAFCQLMVEYYGHRKHYFNGISSTARINPSAKIGKNCSIADNVVICENAEVGDNTIIYPNSFIGQNTKVGSGCIFYANVVVYENCIIGNNVFISANTTIGQDGFGFAPHNGVHHKIPQIGKVIIEDDVEIGANAAIERGTLDDTIIAKGSKIGDMVAIGHGTKIGRGCLVVPQAGIAGSAKVGNYVVIGGQAGIAGHIEIGDFVQIAACAGVINSVAKGTTVMGAPAIDANIARRAYSLIQTLPDMRKDIERLKKKIKELGGDE